MPETNDLHQAERIIRAWQLIAMRETGKSIEELQTEVDALFADEPESLND